MLLLCISSALQAQQIRVRQDFGAWMGLKIEKDLPKGFEFSLEQQLRTCRNSTQVDNYWAELGINYTINKNFRLQGNLRYIHDVNKWKATENSLRYNLDIELRLPLHKEWRLDYRARYQQKFIDAFQFQAATINLRSSTVRNRLKLRWKYNKAHQFYYLTELFVSSDSFTKSYLDQLRFSLGDKLKTKVGIFNIAVGYEVNLQPNNLFSFFFVQLIYQLKL